MFFPDNLLSDPRSGDMQLVLLSVEKICIKIREWSKTFKIKYVEYSEVPRFEDV